MYGFLILVPSLGLFSSCWYALFKFDVIVYYLLLCLAWFVYCHLLEACSLLLRDRKEVNPDGRGGKEELGEKEGGEAVVRI